MDNTTNNLTALSEKISQLLAVTKTPLEYPKFSILLQEKEASIDQKLKLISDQLNILKDTQANLQTPQLKTIYSLCHDTHIRIAAQCERLNTAAMRTVKNAAQLFISVKNNTLQKLTENKFHTLAVNHEKNLARFKKIMCALHWKNLLLALCVSLIASFIVSFYTDNAWPWQAHMQMIKERLAGKVLMGAYDY